MAAPDITAENAANELLPWLRAPLAQALDCVQSHAVLLEGPEGLGQFEFALALASAWLCEGVVQGRPNALACGTCSSCRLIHSRNHPDLIVAMPEVHSDALGWPLVGEDVDDEGKRRERKTKNPSKEIKVDALRLAVAFAQQTGARGRAKVVILHPAERMNHVSANTLLKTLEEPPGATRFILSTGAAHRLLPTIRSRCQSLMLSVPPLADALAWLQSQHLPDADVLLDAAGGQPLLARDLAAVGVSGALWRKLPALALAGEAAPMANWPLPVLVQALQKLCHDALCVAAGAAPRFFPEGSIPRLTQAEPLHAWQRALQAIAAQSEHPWSAALMAESLISQAQRALRTPAPRKAPLH